METHAGVQGYAGNTGQGSVREKEHALGRKLLVRGLKEQFALHLSGPVDDLLEQGENGKPFLREYPEAQFNISHSGGLVVCALSDRPVGVDVELLRPVREALVRRTLHEEERAVLNRLETGGLQEESKIQETLSSEAALQNFFRCWTLKESYLKQDGSGLTKDLREVWFRVDPEEWDTPVCGVNPAAWKISVPDDDPDDEVPSVGGADPVDWRFPVCASDPAVSCFQTQIVRQRGGKVQEYILSVCVSGDEAVTELQLVWV